MSANLRCPYCGGQNGVHAMGCSAMTGGPLPYIALTVSPQMGWECPRCGKIHSPWVAACDCPAPPKPVLDPMYAQILARQHQPDSEQCKTCKSYPQLKCCPPFSGRPCGTREPIEGHLDMRQCAGCAEWGKLLCAPPMDAGLCKNRREIPKTPEETFIEDLAKKGE